MEVFNAAEAQLQWTSRIYGSERFTSGEQNGRSVVARLIRAVAGGWQRSIFASMLESYSPGK